MNNFILISKTFAQTTPESAEVGDFSDTGFISECEQVTFTELVDLMKAHYQPSNSANIDINTWFSTGFYTQDYRTGTDQEDSIHFHRDNTPNAAKYWKLAYTIANKN